jgi:protein transport protein SEC61 subunit gamma-like protein
VVPLKRIPYLDGMDVMGIIKDYISGCSRVMKIARRPNKEEFIKILKLTGLGTIIIGLIGLLITVGSMLVGL